MLTNILLVLMLAIIVVLVLAAMKPATFRLERSTTINAPPDRVFALINDFHNWESWSPWEKIDPGMKRTYSGPSSGVGAAYAWDGNNKAGSGSMKIANSVAPSAIDINLDFVRPFKANNMTEFRTTPGANGATNITWAMHGPNQFMGKLVKVFFNMENLVGRDFERGLANMKAVAEKPVA